MELARAVTGREGISAGKLRLARQLEPFTAVLISINRKYKVHSGLRITGLDHVEVAAESVVVVAVLEGSTLRHVKAGPSCRWPCRPASR